MKATSSVAQFFALTKVETRVETAFETSRKYIHPSRFEPLTCGSGGRCSIQLELARISTVRNDLIKAARK
jgi:hypothetical protein